jgi:lipopolysaccharide biosynthesis protein
MKTIAFYLPQFHQIPENDEWWGKGFTEWTNMKAAKPLYKGHYQPRIPEGGNYYNLTDPDVIRWQAKLANESGVYGWCVYHYWFDGHLLLHKPLELLRNTPDIDIHYCICWANEDWTNAWVSSNSRTLISQTYGGREQWREHFNYLMTFFSDERYILADGKPLMVIYRPELIPHLNEMLDYWTELAIEAGFKGIKFAYQHINWTRESNRDESRFDYVIEYQPAYARSDIDADKESLLHTAKRLVDLNMQKHFHRSLDLSFLRKATGLDHFSYEDAWEAIIARHPTTEKACAGAFVDWDNTPRRHETGSVCDGATPEKFYSYMKRQILHVRKEYTTDFLFIFAWNEWAEGGYMEPDERFHDGYLKALRKALEETGELPDC